MLGHLAMLVFSALVAGSFALGVLAANDITPLALNAARFWIAVVVMGGFGLATTTIPPQAKQAMWRYPLLALPLMTYFVLMFEGLKTAPAVNMAAVFTLTPLLAAGTSWLLLRQRLTQRVALALLVGGLGALWVIFRADFAAFLAFDVGRGEAAYFWGCAAYAFYAPLAAKVSRGEPAVIFTFGILLCGAAMLTLLGWSDIRQTDWTNLPAIVWITIFYTAVFAGAVSFTLVQFAAMRLPAAKVMAHTYLTPTWVILWQIALGGAAPAGMVLVGVALTIVALLMLMREES